MANAPQSPLTSFDLLVRAQAGDREALELLFARYLPDLQRWTRGRLPRWARDIADTCDLVQDTLLQTCKRIDTVEARRDTTLRAYLRQALLNRIRQEYRSRSRRPERGELDPGRPDGQPSPLEQAVAAEMLDAYDAAMDRIDRDERDLLVARIELGLSYEEVAEVCGRPNANAARSAVVRALARLHQELGRGR